MGIKNLWQLLSPVGRSVSIETLSGKTLAVDASIWLTQFIKAMRDEDGKVMKNAHIIGTLRRVVKLLFHRIRPVFVFDGGAPALKGKTLAARRKLRSEGTDASVRKTAQRILASQLKKHKASVNASKRGAGKTAAVEFNPIYQSSDPAPQPASTAGSVGTVTKTVGETVEKNMESSRSRSDERGEGGGVSGPSVEAGMATGFPRPGVSGEGDEDSDGDDDVDWEDPAEAGGGDGRGALGAGREAVVDSDGDEVWQVAGTPAASSSGAVGGVSRAVGGRGEGGGEGDDAAAWAVDSDEDDEEGGEGAWEEVELPDRNEDIDPEVIASLPGHVKKQVIEAAKRRQRMRSRAQYMPVAGDPAMYSQTQLSNFLRSQKLNTQIMQAHKQEGGDMTGKRIASEANRRYIMTPAGGATGGTVTSAGSRNSTVSSSASAAAAAPRGGARSGSSGAPDNNYGGGSSRRRRRRITDEGDDFEEWSYNPPSSRPAHPASQPGGDRGRSGGLGVNDDGGEPRARARASGGEKLRDGGKSGAPTRSSDEDEEEEAGGFLPLSDGVDDEPVSAGRKSGGRGRWGDSPTIPEENSDASCSEDPGEDEDEEEGGGFLVPADSKPAERSSARFSVRSSKKAMEHSSKFPAERSPSPPPLPASDRKGKGRGKGKGKGRRQAPRSSDGPDDSASDGDHSVHVRTSGGRSGKGEHRLQRLAHATDGSDEDEDIGGAVRRAGRRGAELELGAEVIIARHFQEEEDRRAAVALQDEINSASVSESGTAAAAPADDTGAAFSGASRSSRRGGARSVVTAAAAESTTNLSRQRGVFSTSLEVPHESRPGGGKSVPRAGMLEAKGEAGAGEFEVELEVDLTELDAGEGRAALMTLLSSDGMGAGSSARGVAGGGDVGGDSDEDFGGFVDGDPGDEEEDEEEEGDGEGGLSSERAMASATNDAALARSVDVASRMAGWAGRVVERVLKEHRQSGAALPTPASSNSHRPRPPATSGSGASSPSSSKADGPHSGSLSLPIATGIAISPAVPGARGSHAAAQAASEERRRVDGSMLEGSAVGAAGAVEASGGVVAASLSRPRETIVVPGKREEEASGDFASHEGVNRKHTGVETAILREGVSSGDAGAGVDADLAVQASRRSGDTPPWSSEAGGASSSGVRGGPGGSVSVTAAVTSGGDREAGAAATPPTDGCGADPGDTGDGRAVPAMRADKGGLAVEEEKEEGGAEVESRSAASAARKANGTASRIQDGDRAAGQEATSEREGPDIDRGGKISVEVTPSPLPPSPGITSSRELSSSEPQAPAEGEQGAGESARPPAPRLTAVAKSAVPSAPGAILDRESAPGLTRRPASAIASAAAEESGGDEDDGGIAGDDFTIAVNVSSDKDSGGLAGGGERTRPAAASAAVAGAVDLAPVYLDDGGGGGGVLFDESEGTAALFRPEVASGVGDGGSSGGSGERFSSSGVLRGGSTVAGETAGVDEGGFDGDFGGVLSRLGDMDEEELGEESERLRRESNRAQRDAETVTEEMKEDVIELLQLFGVPYVVAPMEAEAQCCELERLRLVDGTVTDDSDAFAFGGRTVYKNIFNDKKFVEAYLLADAENDLGVSTDEVIALALLLGSDYTEGVRGVGIVNAMEIINAFPLEGNGPQHGLSKFKNWIDGFDPLLDQELEDLLKNGTKADIEALSLERRFHLKHRTARNRWTVSEGFPSAEVINAYKCPQVDKSEEPFSWATPDVDGLRALCKRVLGWDRTQADGLLMPMVKELDQGAFAQPRIDRYFMTYHDNRRVAAIKSKRLRTAVEDLANGSTEVMTVKGSAASTAVASSRNRKAKTNTPAPPVGTGTRYPSHKRPTSASDAVNAKRRRKTDTVPTGAATLTPPGGPDTPPPDAVTSADGDVDGDADPASLSLDTDEARMPSPAVDRAPRWSKRARTARAGSEASARDGLDGGRRSTRLMKNTSAGDGGGGGKGGSGTHAGADAAVAGTGTGTETRAGTGRRSSRSKNSPAVVGAAGNGRGELPTTVGNRRGRRGKGERVEANTAAVAAATSRAEDRRRCPRRAAAAASGRGVGRGSSVGGAAGVTAMESGDSGGEECDEGDEDDDGDFVASSGGSDSEGCNGR